MKVSYYELLGMIKDNNIPKEIYLCILDRKIKYKAICDGEYFNYYEIADKNNQTNDFNFYLRDCLLDCESFKKIIEIVPKKIKKFNNKNDIYSIDEKFNDKVLQAINRLNYKLDNVVEAVNEIKGKE